MKKKINSEFSYEEFCDLAFNPKIEIYEFVPINQDTIFVNWAKNLDSFTPSDRAVYLLPLLQPRKLDSKFTVI